MTDMDVVINYVWPDVFPDGVPPQNASVAIGVVYRISTNMPPVKDDFKMTRNEASNFGKNYDGENLINSYGVSVFSDIQDARKLKKRFENRLSEDHFVVMGNLIPELGKMAKTYRKSHYTIWFQVSARPYEHINEEIN